MNLATLELSLVRNKSESVALFYWGILNGVLFERGNSGNTKRPDMGGLKKIPRGQGSDQVVEPESGRMIQTQVINLVIGVVSRPTRITHAASDRFGSCGAKLHERVHTNTSGKPAYSFPSGSHPIHHKSRSLASRPSFFRERGCQQAFGSLLRCQVERGKD